MKNEASYQTTTLSCPFDVDVNFRHKSLQRYSLVSSLDLSINSGYTFVY